MIPVWRQRFAEAENEIEKNREHIDRTGWSAAHEDDQKEVLKWQNRGLGSVLRVNQLDGDIFELEISKLLQIHWKRAFEHWPSIKNSAEVLLVLEAVVFYLGVWHGDAGYGHRLQNLVYRDASTGRAPD